MTKPFSIRIYATHGDPEGVRLVEKSNWSGIGIVIPRGLFADARGRKELGRTGVYVLIGPAEESRLPRVYVGEGDPILPRLERHALEKDFWTSVLAFIAKDESLNKAHVQYLEARLVQLAWRAKRCVLDNGNVPGFPSLSEADAADAEGFLSEMLLCLPVLGVSVFVAAESTPDTSRKAPHEPETPRLEIPVSRVARGIGTRLHANSRNARGEGEETSAGFVVFAGSVASRETVPSCHDYLVELRRALTENGVLRSGTDGLEFTQDYVFPSPSTAAGVLLGRSSNGRVEWRTSAGRTLKELQEAALGRDGMDRSARRT